MLHLHALALHSSHATRRSCDVVVFYPWSTFQYQKVCTKNLDSSLAGYKVCLKGKVAEDLL